ITSTRGTGELILAAAASGAHRIVIGIGGSATNDGGAGMARALGYRFIDALGQDLPEGGTALARLHHLEGQTDPRPIRPATAGADLVITGEGRADAQSAYGKLTQAVTRAASDAGVRAAMIVGGTAPGYEALLVQGLEAIEVSTPEGMTVDDAMRNAEPLIEEA